jgi:hypothetical protein
MSTSDHQKLRGSWLVAGWLLLILSGGLMSSLIRAPQVLSSMTPILVMSHLIGGAAMTIMAIARLGYAKEMMRSWRLLLLAATPALGWLAYRSFSPLRATTHAAVAAVASLALAHRSRRSVTEPTSPQRSWTLILAIVGFSLVLVQVVVGAALRHHVMSLSWHLVVGGLATMAVLAAAIATTQDQHTTVTERRAARSAIAAVVLQVSLGVAVLFMIFVGPPNAATWITVTVAHVLGGSLTLLAVGRFIAAVGAS